MNANFASLYFSCMLILINGRNSPLQAHPRLPQYSVICGRVSHHVHLEHICGYTQKIFFGLLCAYKCKHVRVYLLTLSCQAGRRLPQLKSDPIWLQRAEMATREREMEKFLSAIVQGKTSVWTVNFRTSTIEVSSVGETNVMATVYLKEYPDDIRKDFIQKLRLANISSLAIETITVSDVDFRLSLKDDLVELLDGHTTLSEDIAEIIKALHSTPTTEESNVVGDSESQNDQAECNLMEVSVSSTHQIEPNNRTLTAIVISGELPPQKLKAVCGLIVAPGSTVRSVDVYRSPEYKSLNSESGRAPLVCTVLEEMLSASQKGGSCPALESLTFDPDLEWNGTSVERLGEFLQRTPSIKKIEFQGDEDFNDDALKFEGSTIAERLAEALCLNNHVHTLEVGEPVLRNLADDVVRVLMRDSQGQHPITALNCLHLTIGKDWNENLLCEFIKTAKCLKALHIFSWFSTTLPLKVIEALKLNHGLEHFTWNYRVGVDVDEDVVFSTIMDALRVNYQLKDFVYRWRNNYYAEALTMLFEERATNKPWEVMKDMVLVPSTSARLFFCGYPHAGKTTLKNTLVKSLREKMEELGSTSKRRKISHNQFTDDVGMNACDAMDTWDMHNRTRGIEVEAVTTLNNLHLTMWDMAGHDAYHPFHDLVISNIDGGGSSCCFLLLCNLFEPGNPTNRKRYMEMANEIKYWLQFIASNTKKSIVYHPCVKLVFTGFDKVKSFVETIKGEIEKHVQPLREQFQDTLNINKELFYVNAHDTESTRPVLEELEATLLGLLPTLPHVFKACEDLRKFLDEYKETNPTHTLVKWEVFEAICDKVPSLVAGEGISVEGATKRREIVATSLHEAGEVIYYKDLNFVILDPHWFCHDVIGQVISCKDCGILEPQMGVLPSTSLLSFLGESQLQKFDEETGQDLLKLMMKLDLCIEHVNDNILIPASLCDDKNNPSDSGERKLSWLTKKTFHKGVHVGRRVAPVDTNRTMLTLGFFPRLQVSFQRSFEQNGYIIEKNMISFVWNEMEIILEYSGHIGFHIDIFIRSQGTNEGDVYEFLTNHIIKHIFQECSHPIRGCPGVVLEESIIRPSCAKDLVLCKNRVNQIISVQMLKENIKSSNSLKFTHAWKQEGVLDPGYDKALTLLSDTEKSDVIGYFSKLIKATKQSLMKLPRHELELTGPLEANDQDMKMGMEKMERNLMSTFKSTELVVMELYERQRSETQTLIESKLEDFILMVQNKFREMSLQSDASISTLSSKLQESLTFDVELERTGCPKFVWFKGSEQRMEAKKKHQFDWRGTKYTVHILCETLIGEHMHEVENQQGIEIKVDSESSAKIKNILKYTLATLSTLIAIGAHVFAPGMGNLVSDLAKGFLLVLDTPGVLDSGLKVITPSLSNLPNTILHANKEARKWLEGLLHNQDIEDLFGLYKVRYKNCEDGINGRVAWICKKCKDLEENRDKYDLLGCKLYYC